MDKGVNTRVTSSFKAHPLVYTIGILPPVGNKGDESIYISSLMLIRKYLPDSVIALAFPPRWYYEGVRSPWTGENVFTELSDIIVRHPLDMVGEGRDDLSFKLLRFLYYRSHPYFSSFLPTMLMSFLNRRKSTANYIKEADVNVTLSFPFESANILFCYSIIIPRLLNKRPTILFPISLTTDAHLGNRPGTFIRKALINADMIFTRGHYTTKWLLQKLKIPHHKILTSADPSFLLNHEENCKCEIEIEQDSAALVPHPILTQDTIVNIVDVMLKFFDHIYIVPTEVKDLKLVKPLTCRLNPNRCTLLDVSEVHPHAVKSIFQKFRLVVTFRSHAGILALTSGTPTIMINSRSDLKFMDILGHYSLERYFAGVEDLTLRPHYFFTAIASMIKEIADSYSGMKKTIIERNYLIKNLAELPGRYLKGILE